MAKLIIVRNPFEPWDGREVKEIESGVSLAKVKAENHICAPMNVWVSVNTKVMPDDYIVGEGDFVVISPAIEGGGGSKNILGVVAAIAISVVSFGVGGLASGVGWGAGTAAWSTMGYIAAAATMFIGSTLVSRMIGTGLDMGSYSGYDNNPTYSWDGVTTMEGQNNGIALTYGKVMSGGQSISKYVDVKGDDEYLNWLVSAGEGPLEITNIKLNDNDISYYDDCTYETRSGTNDQSVIENFNDTYFTKELGYELVTSRVDVAQGNATEGIKVKLACNNGLYYADDSGSLSTAWVDVAGYYRLEGASTWTQFIGSSGGGYRISGAQSNARRCEFRLDHLPAGKYEVKIEVTGRSHATTNSRAQTKIYWNELTSIVYDDFSYPNIALIGIKVKATSQISGNPSLTFIKKRANVLVWNPYTNRYEDKPADNPAWASYDVLHQCSKLRNINTNKDEYEVRGVPAKYIQYDHFLEWATFCATKNLKVNIELTNTGEMLDVINQNIANVGRGQVVRFGTRYGAVWNCAKTPVQMFGMGNIISGSFSEEFMQTSDRANCVEVTYTDAANNYNRETITIYDETYDSAGEERTAQATFNGITSYEQAYREGMYQLFCNKYLLRTVTFEANIDSIACTIGDVILVSHDVPMWAKSGRIYSVNGQRLKLPVELDSTTGQYRIMYRTLDDVLHTSNVTIVSNADGWCEVDVNTTFTEATRPAPNDVFDLALANIGSKPFIVKAITRAQDFTRKITCLEYNANIYEEEYDIPVINYTTYDRGVKNVEQIKANRYTYLTEESTIVYRLAVSWVNTSRGTYVVYGSKDGNAWTLLAKGVEDSFYVADVPGEINYVKVVTTDGAKLSSGVIAEVEDVSQEGEIAGLDVSDLKATSVYREYSNGGCGYDILVTCTVPEMAETVEVYYKQSNPSVDTLGVIAEGLAGNEFGYNRKWQRLEGDTITGVTVGDVYILKARAKTANGIIGGFCDEVSCTVEARSTIPSQVDNLTFDWLNGLFTWNDVADADVQYYELRTNEAVGAATGLLAKTSNCFATVSVARSGKAYVYAVNSQKVAGYPCTVEWNIPKPLGPVITVTPMAVSTRLEVATFNEGITGMKWYITRPEAGFNSVVESKNCSYDFTGEAGIYSVKAAYIDVFGEGELSQETLVTIEPQIDGSYIEDGTITSDKVTAAINEAITKGVTGYDNSITIVGNLNDTEKAKSYSAIAQMDTAIGLRVEKSGVINAINMSAEGTTIDGKYLHVTGDTAFDNNVIVGGMIKAGAISADKIASGAVTAEKVSVTSLSALCATLGTFKSASTGARVEISDSIVKVYDENNVCRVELGVW